MKKVEDLPFPYVIEMTTGHKVIPISEEDKEVIEEISRVAEEIAREVSMEVRSKEEEYRDKRPNEISNVLEKMVREKLNGRVPEGKSAGYPDIEIERGGKTYYIEVKLAGIDKLDSSLRAFFYEPVDPPKITKNASHILLGFLHRDKKIVGFKLVDLSKVSVRIKHEFNANNKEIYRDDALLTQRLLE